LAQGLGTCHKNGEGVGGKKGKETVLFLPKGKNTGMEVGGKPVKKLGGGGWVKILEEKGEKEKLQGKVPSQGRAG